MSGGGEASFDCNTADVTDITSDKSLLLGLTSNEDKLFAGSNSKTTPVDSVQLIDAERRDNDDYGKRKRTENDDSLLNGTATTDESIVSTDPSDHDSSAKDESDLSDSMNSSHNASNVGADEFPSTVSVLQSDDGAKVYLIGTAHFSKESMEDVSKVIQKVRPHIVMVELCAQRVNILHLDEKTILEEAKNLNLKKIKGIIDQNGLFNSLIYILLLNMSAHITKQLGIAPGGEFRRAIQEADKIPNCLVQLGDRPIQVTMKRALSALSWWQAIKLVWRLLMTNDPISNEDVEQCKQRELLTEMLDEMENEFPALKKVFLEERDTYLTYSLQKAASNKHPYGPMCVVGVVGMGHVQGILNNWGHVTYRAIPPIMKIPPPSLSSRIIKVTFKVAFVGLVAYAGYKVVPRRWF